MVKEVGLKLKVWLAIIDRLLQPEGKRLLATQAVIILEKQFKC